MTSVGPCSRSPSASKAEWSAAAEGQAGSFGTCIADERTEVGTASFAPAVPAVAALLAAAGLSRGDVLAIILPNWVARFKVPREVYIEVVLPKNAIGKLAKPVLRDRLRA